ncbi:cupin domain-containing protein [Helicobacter saguini]|uniref:mannose-1-phosphate guanylyltransferase n=1 Tax=Helicobacter saguini TaxID=1548018 RepID=A0A347VT12_9HELI|nr:sugar phosphate nucleotidyltransferase [Helicobacter saguini]MWV62280.1 cupin domain-containing protein [Helicobacter saguini]MWV67047.1 cupin domain-containing protein [Helicobacter saguini]MWV69397.1 cupin domain-containing protein [Helicobacter saguini]MWV71049.1 cupin domain-containing protein [Helicobacter saguini]TLD95046.1 cupin domain-containing protein [Helicobacter saguini]
MVISILCGGSGTRLWPISRELMPKQFARLIGNDSLFKLTLERNVKLLGKNDSLQVITNDKHYFLALDEAAEVGIKVQSFILESIAKNTAAALTFAALLTAKTNPNEVILTLPSDHIIHDFPKYKSCVESALKLAESGNIVTFGIKPNTPHTGYGYIQIDSKDSKSSGVKKDSKSLQNIESSGLLVRAFHEKPDIKTAQKYVKEGNFFWNSGMFCYKANVLLDEMKTYQKEIYNACVTAFEKSYKDSNIESKTLDSKSKDSKLDSKNGEFLRLDKTLSEKIPELSIDYAVMEKTKKLKMIVGDFVWNDVGSFDSLDSEYEKDGDGNAKTCEIESIDSKNNLILAEKNVAMIGVNDFVVVDSSDVLLIAKKGQTQDVKKIVEQLKKKNSELVVVHNTAFRPWGSYTVLQEKPNYKLKSIVVKPKQRLSLQKHFHRNEHWIIVSGSAIVQVGKREIFLKANESTYIPMGEVHRLTNPGIIDLVMIEVQVGEYLGEDDIVRLSDDYKRN